MAPLEPPIRTISRAVPTLAWSTFALLSAIVGLV